MCNLFYYNAKCLRFRTASCQNSFRVRNISITLFIKTASYSKCVISLLKLRVLISLNLFERSNVSFTNHQTRGFFCTLIKCFHYLRALLKWQVESLSFSFCYFLRIYDKVNRSLSADIFHSSK